MDIIDKMKLKAAMLAACMSISELAAAAEVTPATISKLLKSDSPCRLPTLGKIARVLGVRADSLILTEEV